MVAVLGFGATDGVLAPALCVAIAPAAAIARLTRSALLDVAGEPNTRLTVEAVLARDLPVVQGAVLCAAAAYLVLVLAVDVAVRWVDPRERTG